MGIGEKDVKWDAHHQVVAKIIAAENHLKLTVVTPRKAWIKNRCDDSDSDRSSHRESPSPIPPSNIIPVFPPSMARTSFSSLSSSTSGSSCEQGEFGRKKRSWAVFKIRE